MKKISILCICAMTAAGAMAQESVVKEADRAMKKDPNLEAVLKIITPAFSDPTTKDQAFTYYVPGMAAYKQFDNMFAMQQLGKLDDSQKPAKARLLLKGYEFMSKALPLDSVAEVDKKGNTKIKTKYSKDIIGQVSGHYTDLYSAGIDLYNADDKQGAYDLWNLYTTVLPSNPAYAGKLTLPADTVMAEVAYNQALAAWQIDKFDDALASFLKAKSLGYTNKNLYDYAIGVASQAGKDDVVLALCEEALPLYGKEDSKYIGLIINDYIKNNKSQEALTVVDQAIANDPDNAQYYVIKGVLYEQDGVEGDPIAMYKKAIELDPNNAQAAFRYGYLQLEKAREIYNNAPAGGAEFKRVFDEEFSPVMKEAVKYFEKAYELDDENIDALRGLEEGYYLLNDEANMQRVQGLIKLLQ
ncbi:MAG: tetratricopeptide repeat protein [Clostridium sp.]|nr:tetratricopeptide repeat protein [Clostridium sp.]